jgi:type I restriction enzyme S subunit
VTELRRTTLGELCVEGGGEIQTGPFGSQLHASDYVSVGVPAVMPTNIGDNVIDDAGIARIDEKDAVRLERYRLHQGDIVYSRRGDVERRALVRAANEGWLCGTGCLRVRLGPNTRADSAYVSFLLGTETSRSWIVRNAVGATMANLNTAILGRLPLTLPPVPVQRAIAEVLGALDDKIAVNSALNETLSEFGSTLVRSTLDGAASTPLATVAAITMGSSPSGDTFNDRGDGVVFFQGVKDFDFRYPRPRVWTTAPVRVAPAGACLVSVRAPVGRVNIASIDSCIGRGLAAVSSKSNEPHLLFHLLTAAREAWLPFEAEGTVFGSINRRQLQAVKLSALRPGVQSGALESRLREFEDLIEANLAESRRLTELRDALLPELTSGRLRVKDAEKRVEAVV